MIDLKEKYTQLSVEKRAGIWALFAGVIQKGIGIVLTPIFTRVLTTDEYAQFTLYQSWHDIFIIFSTLNVYFYCTYTALSKFYDDKEEYIISAQSLISILSFVFAAFFLLFQSTIAKITHFDAPVMVLMTADILFLGTFNIWLTKERYEFKYKIMTLLSVLNGCIGPLLSFTFILLMDSNKGFGRVYGMALSNICIGFSIYIYHIKQAHKVLSTKYWRYIITFCIPLIPHYLSTILLSRSDRLMINEYCGSSDVAVYSLAYSIASLLTIFNDAIMKVLTPWTYRAIKESKFLSIARNTTILLGGVALITLVLILIAPEIVYIFAPSEYRFAVYLVPPLSCSIYFVFLFSLFANVEYYYSETKFVAAASIIAAISNIILNYLFIRMFGFIAAGYTTLASYIMYSVGHFVFMRIVLKKYKQSTSLYNIRSFFIISSILIISSLAVIPLYNFTVFRYLIVSLILLCFLIFRNHILKILYG